MASAVTSCAPCVLGAVSSSILTYPYQVVGTVQVSVIPHLNIVNGSTQTNFQTTTLSDEIVSVSGSPTAGGPVIDVTGEPTWTTLGTTLTYPTTYVEYLAFAGAATANGCAQTLPPTPLALPSNTVPASFIYPAAATLPPALLNYLDSASGFSGQLDGDSLGQCGALPGILADTLATTTPPASSAAVTTFPSTSAPGNGTGLTTISTTSLSTISSSTTIVTSTPVTTSATVTTPTTLTTTLPPPTTITTSTSAVVPTVETVETSQVIASAAATVTFTSARIFNTVTGQPIVTTGGTTSVFTSSPPTPQPESLGTTTTTSSSSSSESSSQDLGTLLSILQSLSPSSAAPTFANTTSASTTTVVVGNITQTSSFVVGPITASPTSNRTNVTTASSSSIAVFTGAAPHHGVSSRSLSFTEYLLGVVIPFLLW